MCINSRKQHKIIKNEGKYYIFTLKLIMFQIHVGRIYRTHMTNANGNKNQNNIPSISLCARIMIIIRNLFLLCNVVSPINFCMKTMLVSDHNIF